MDETEREFQKMYMIRRFEERVLNLFKEGGLSGTTHAYIGQEANAVGVIDNLKEKDIVFSSHRCHGHYLAKTGNATGLLSELLGKETGIVSGRGGSQHICDDNFYTNGVQGGIVPVCSGMALAEKHKGSGSMATVFIGDGTLGEGVVYETLNMSSLWDCPLLIVLENNRYAQSTHVDKVFNGNMKDRFESFGIPALEVKSFDVKKIKSQAKKCISEIRNKGGPHALVIHTYRFCSHSKSPDGRDPSEVKKWKEENDPLDIQRSRLDEKDINRIQKGVQNKISNIIDYVKKQNDTSINIGG